MFTTYDSFTTSHEALFQQKPLSDVPAKKLIEMPLLAVWPDGTAAALTEARLRNFAGMYLERPDAGAYALFEADCRHCQVKPTRSLPQRCPAGVHGELCCWQTGPANSLRVTCCCA